MTTLMLLTLEAYLMKNKLWSFKMLTSLHKLFFGLESSKITELKLSTEIFSSKWEITDFLVVLYLNLECQDLVIHHMV